jgi:hypothetical protein
MNEPHISVGIAHQPTGSPPGTMVPVGIQVSVSLGDGYSQTCIIITKEVAHSVAKMLAGLADDMEEKKP